MLRLFSDEDVSICSGSDMVDVVGGGLPTPLYVIPSCVSETRTSIITWTL